MADAWPGTPVQQTPDVQWPGTPVKAAAVQWPGTPVKAAAVQWPGTPVKAAAPPASEYGEKVTMLKVPKGTTWKDTISNEATGLAKGAKDYLSTGAGQLVGGVISGAKELGSQIKGDFDVGTGVAKLGAQELKTHPVQAAFDMIMGGTQAVMAPITGAVKAGFELPVDPGMVPEMGEKIPEVEAPAAKPGIAARIEPTMAPKPPTPAREGAEAPSVAEAFALTAQPVGAAAASTADILRGNINDRAKAEAAAKPGFIEGVKRAGERLKSGLGLDVHGETTKAVIQKNAGRAFHIQQQASAAFGRDARRLINQASLEDRLDIIDYIQHRSEKDAAGWQPDPAIKPLIDSVRDIMQHYEKLLKSRPETEQMEVRKDFLKQMWLDKEPGKPQRSGTGGKEGSKSSLKKRVFADYAEGIRAGRIPTTTDPIELVLNYAQAIGDHIAAKDSFETLKEIGEVVGRTPGKEPDGWVALKGSIARSAFHHTQQAYAPEGTAVIWNNFVSREFDNRIAREGLRRITAFTHAVTAFKMALSARHALNMVYEGIGSGINNTLFRATHLDIKGAAKSFIPGLLQPLVGPLRGHGLTKAFLDDTYGSPELRRIVNAAIDANFRLRGKGRAIDEYHMKGAVNLFRAFREGSIKAEIAASARDIHGHPIAGSLRALNKTMKSVMETMASPLFDVYIPKLKSGAFFNMMKTHLDLNPGITDEELTAYARKAGKIIDQRFGEMNQNNIFWDKNLKLASQAAVFSYSYELGTAGMAGSAITDTLRAPGKILRGENPFTERNLYPVAVFLSTALINGIIQYLYTGQMPQDLHDLMSPRTGGVVPGGPHEAPKPERTSGGGYQPQFISAIDNPLHELGNKVNPGLKLIYDALANQDWRGDPIKTSDGSSVQVLQKYFDFIHKSLEAIPFESDVNKGSNLGLGSRILGLNPAGMRANDPKDYTRMQAYLGFTADGTKAYHDLTDKTVRDTGERPRISKRRFVDRYVRMKMRTWNDKHSDTPTNTYKGSQQ